MHHLYLLQKKSGDSHTLSNKDAKSASVQV